MIKYQKLPRNILQFLNGAEDYLQNNPKVKFSYLFGSLARGIPSPLSDVDIAVYLADTVCVIDDKLEILGRLMEILQTDEIDLVVLNTASISLIMKILRSKKVIVDKDPFARHIFESLAMRKSFDFSIMESAQLRRRYFDGR